MELRLWASQTKPRPCDVTYAGQYNLDTFDGELNQAAVNEHHAETVNVSQAPVVEYVNPSLAPPVQPSSASGVLLS